VLEKNKTSLALSAAHT